MVDGNTSQPMVDWYLQVQPILVIESTNTLVDCNTSQPMVDL